MMHIKTGFWIVLTLFLWSSGAMAQPLGLYAVKDVASNDSLNVRSSADAGSQDIGDIAYDGQVSIIGFNEPGKSANIPWGGSTGWVSLRFLRLVQVEPKVIPVALQCGGTEPFWLADVSQDAVLFQMMAGPQTTAPMDWAAPAAGRRC